MSSTGTDISAMQTVTYKGTCDVLSDEETKRWFRPTLASRNRSRDTAAIERLVRLNDTPDRRVLRVTPIQRIGFVGSKMELATIAAIERGDA